MNRLSDLANTGLSQLGQGWGGWAAFEQQAQGLQTPYRYGYGILGSGIENAYQGVPEVMTPSGAELKRQDAAAKRVAAKAEIIRLVRDIVAEMVQQLDSFEAVKGDGKPHIVKQGNRVYLQYTGRQDENDGSYQWAHNFLADIQDFLRAYANKDEGETNDINRELRLAKDTLGVN